MVDAMTTVLYVVVLAGWCLLVCVVLRCCNETDSHSIFFDLEEIAISAGGPKPMTVVDGQPVRFARVQPLIDSPTTLAGVAAASADATSAIAASQSGNGNDIGGGSAVGGGGHRLDRLEMAPVAPAPASALPAAEEVWSPILALRTFVEPLASRASAAFRDINFHVSFHPPDESASGATTTTATAVVPAMPAGAAGAAGAVPEAQSGGGEGGGSRDGGGWANDRFMASTFVASAESYRSTSSGGIEVSVVQLKHRVNGEGGGEEAGAPGPEEEMKSVDVTEVV